MLVWSDHYLMGVEELDREHWQMFEIAGKLLERLRTRDDEAATRVFLVREGMNYLYGYFGQHAAREETYMRQIGYQRYALHKLQHEEFKKNQLAKYRKIVESGVCSKEEAWDFIGNGIGWLLEHIATADMDIVGKGVLRENVASNVDISTLEHEIDLLFAATLNLDAHTKVINTNYMGEPFGKTIYQKIIYEHNGRMVTVLSGIEISFVLSVAKALYGDGVEDEMTLVLSTVEMFGAQFWVTLYRQMTGDCDNISVKESHFLVGAALREELHKLKATVSLLFTSENGKFFLSSNTEKIFLQTATSQ